MEVAASRLSRVPDLSSSRNTARSPCALGRVLTRTSTARVPMRRLGLEAEVSAAIVFLLSPAAAFISGVTLQIDGAASLGSEIFPLGGTAKSVPFDGFHRARSPEVLQPSPEVPT